jgi:hypothetical protein
MNLEIEINTIPLIHKIFLKNYLLSIWDKVKIFANCGILIYQIQLQFNANLASFLK